MVANIVDTITKQYNPNVL